MYDREVFINAMSALAGGVTIITTGHGEARAGLTATAMCSLSADPPSVLVCMNKRASTHDLLLAERHFAVNVLSAQQRDLALHFANSKLSGQQKFTQGDWGTLATGAPILLAAQAIFDCELERVIDGFSHSILIGLVKHALVSEDREDQGLVWHSRRFRGLVDFLSASAKPMVE